MRYCQLFYDGVNTKCRVCDRVISGGLPTGTRARCGVSQNIGIGLGDILERELKRLNITQEAYIKLKVRFGAMPTCNCEKRKQWLNRVGKYLGVGR